MEFDPLSPSPFFSPLETSTAISDSVPNNSPEKPTKSSRKQEKTDSPTSNLLSDFICFVCNNEFDDMAKLHVHMSMKHKGIKPYRCEYCGKVFSTTKSVCVHLQLQHSGRDDKYLCVPCKGYFRTANDLLDHNAVVHKKNHQCDKCVKCFSQMNELLMHERSHTFTKPFRCKQCDEAFMTQSSLSLHINRVHEFNIERQIHCHLCEYSFSKPSDLNAHIYVHIDDENFECPDCSELFDNLEMFIEHVEVHEKNTRSIKELPKCRTDVSEDVQENFDDSNDFVDNSAMDDVYDYQTDDNENKDDLSKLGVTLSYTCPICDKTYENITEFNTHCKEHETPAANSQVTKINSKSLDGMLKPNRPKKARAAVSLKWQENDNKVRNFSCDKCNRSFTMASTLSLHLRRTHLGIKPYKCQVCEWAFAQSSDLIKHMRKHTGERPYSCATCGARFTQNRNLRNHMKIHTDEPSVCQYCKNVGNSFKPNGCVLFTLPVRSQIINKEEFLIDTSLVQHLKKHEGPNVINCTVCKIPFANQSYLDKHAKRCVKKEKHQCTQCDKSFFKAGDLVKHNRERPYVCSLCNKTFSHPTSLRNHNAVHTKLRPFICSYCGQAFSIHGNLKVHLLSHSGEKPFSCQTCGKQFARSANLKEHIKIHTGEKNYKCSICQKSFTNSSTFSKHKKIHSGEKPHHCSVCSRSFSQHAHLVKHTRIHTNEKPYGCDVCNKYFRRSKKKKNLLNNKCAAHLT